MILAIFFSTFITVFIAELGDKTQLATLTISGNSKRPLAVFIGSSLALVLASLLGVLLGGSMSKFLPEILLQVASSIGFFVIGCFLLISSDEN